jgi:HAE1 family hydrophobic/amphiphilic exporter-1
MSRRPALWNVRSSFEGGPPELRIVLDRALADGLGVDLDLVTATLEASLDGRRATVLTMGDEERDIVLRLPRVRRSELLAVQLATADGARIAVGDVARLEPASGAREIWRRDQRRVARVTARVGDGYEFPQARDAARAAIAEAELPAGLVASVTGEEEERARTFDELRFAGTLALLLLFLVLAATFESLLHPLTVVSAVPLSLVGVAAVLGPLGRPIGVMESLGLIVLAGVAVNDSILLVDAARVLVASGMPVRAALARAAAIRLRPILMTTLTAVLAMLPLAIGTDEAARLRTPMALTIIGGLTASMIASLYVVPCVYLLIERARPRRAGRTLA